MMDIKVIATLAFAAGAIVGAASTYIFMHKQTEEKVNAAIQPVRDEFDKALQQMEADKKKFEDNVEASVRKKMNKEAHEKEVKAVNKKAEDLGYKKKDGRPYLIDQGGEEFGGYMAVSLDYYSDGILLDGNDIISDADKDDLVGIENLALLSDTKPEIWVRNDKLKVDYEIAYVDEDFYFDEY